MTQKRTLIEARAPSAHEKVRYLGHDERRGCARSGPSGNVCRNGGRRRYSSVLPVALGSLSERRGSGPATLSWQERRWSMSCATTSHPWSSRRGACPHRRIRLSRAELDGYALYAYADDLGPSYAFLNGIPYEPHVTALVRQRLRNGNTFLDIGANVGYFTLLARSLVGSDGRVIAVEPSERNVRALRRGLDSNDFDDVRIVWVRRRPHGGCCPLVSLERTESPAP